MGSTKLQRKVSPGAFILLVLLYMPARVWAQSGVVRGVVTDAQTGDPLPGANVHVDGTAIGAATDVEGTYRRAGVPAGPQTLVVSYLGYQTARYPITVEAGATVVQDAALRFGIVEGEEVVVTAQLEGQARAINQQLSSNTIVNVVSSDRIQELPDQNAAESIGRLPGISVQRNAGEGQKVVVRGLSPKFNAITINGERIPSTDPQDRSVDLSMISPDVLAGIEVFKALTPDKDGDAIGGTVNLVIRRAPETFQGNLRLQTGYSSQADALGQYKGSLTLSDRFLVGKLGLLATGSVQRADRSSDVFSADYAFQRETQGTRGVVIIENLNLADRIETRDRYSGSLALDYDLPGGGLLLSSFFARTERDEVRRRKRYRVDAGRTEYDLRDRSLNTNLFTNSLSGRHAFPFVEVGWRVSYAYTQQHQPYSHYARFQEVGSYQTGLVYDQGPGVIPGFARNDLESTWLQYATFNPEETEDRDVTAQLDVRAPFRVGEGVAGYVKAGAKHRDKHRENDLTEFRTPFAETDEIGQENADKYALYRNEHIAISNFLDPTFSVGDAFLDGQYAFGPGLDQAALGAFYDDYHDRYQLNRYVELSDYEAGEAISAGYAMAEVNVGQQLMVLPGVRYERTSNDYAGRYGQLRDDLGARGAIRDSTGGQTYGEWLPMVHVRYRFTPWLDLRLAATRTLSRPDYYNLVPFEEINESEQLIRRGNPQLKHTTAWSYDAFLSLYESRLGLFTIGAFYKRLRNIDYLKQNFRVQSGEFANFAITEPANADASTLYGAEVEVQTNLRFLPSPLDGIVLSANYAYAYSETFFPYFEIGPRSPDPPYRPTVIDTVRKGRMPGQSDHIANLSVGYEKGGFSGRVSMIYQGKYLALVGTRSELDGFTDDFVRWDATLSQRLGGLRGLQLFASVNNLSNRPEGAFLGITAFPANEELFGWTADVGVRYEF